MKYLIANKVIYDTEHAELAVHSAENPQRKKLTDTANRILSLLVASHGKVLERQFLLEQVWESAGHASSSSSLNQYISILRKTLTFITGIEETIIVAPKVGFCFSSDITVQLLKADEEPELSEDNETSQKKHKTVPFAYICSTALVAFVLLVANIWLMLSPDNTNRYANVVDLGKFEQCSIHTYETVTPDIHERLMHVLDTVVPNLREKCRKHTARVTIYVQPSVLFNSSGRVFQSFCIVDKKIDETTWCENLYTFNWKMQ